MASTFTGFKLQGDLGKFGKTEISDIEGYAELPDGKVGHRIRFLFFCFYCFCQNRFSVKTESQ